MLAVPLNDLTDYSDHLVHPDQRGQPPVPPTAAPPAHDLAGLGRVALATTPAEFASYWRAGGLRGGDLQIYNWYSSLFRQASVYPSGRPDGVRVPVADLGIIAPIHRVHRSESSEGVVTKFTQVVQTFVDGRPPLEIESVLIPMIGRNSIRKYTLCVSSQVGCAMGCGFCQTAQMGLIRSLSVAEIVGQWFAARHLIEHPDPEALIANIVFMGMGEPLDNFDNVVQAIAVLTDRRAANVAMRHITVSTVGRAAEIDRLAERVRQPGWHRLGLAVSLNAPTDAVRSSIMPINKAIPMAALRRPMEQWPFFGGAHLCLEYVLIPGVNDTAEHAEQLAAYVQGADYEGPAEPRYPGVALTGLVNVIPYNPRDNSPWPAPTEEQVVAFMAVLTARRVPNKRRRTKGRDTMAACGQLGNPTHTRRSLKASPVEVTVLGR